MPIILLVSGIILILAAVHGKALDLFENVGKNFVGTTPQTSYILWAVAIFLIAAIGYWKAARPVVIAFLILIFVVMILENNSKALSAIQTLTNKI